MTASAASGSTSVTVPADCTAAIAFWAHFNALGTSTLSTKTLGGNAFTTESEIATKSPTATSVGVGVASLTNLPGTGSQTFAWAWSDSDARDEGGGIFIVWVKDVDTTSLVHHAQTGNSGGSTNLSVTVNTDTTDLLLAFCESFTGTNPGLDATVFLNDVAINSEVYDLSQITPGSPTTAVNMTGESDSAMAAISLKTAAVVTQTLRPDADTTTTGWTSTPLFSKINETSADGTVITATAS